MRYRIIALSHLQRQPFNKVCNERKSALSRDKIAVIIPCYNEALTIGKVIDDFRRELPEAAKALCEPILAKQADMVAGDRLSNGTYAQQNARAFHGFGNDLVRFMIKWIYGYAYPDVMTGYRAMSKSFIKTFPVLSEGFQIETELSIHAVDHRWRILNIPIDYRDRPEGSVSKLNTVSDGLKVIAMIGTLFKDYRPLKFFSLIALAFCIGGLCAGMPVVSEYLATGLVPRLPTAILAVAFMFIAALSLATGFILDAVAKVERKQWELHVYRQAENE